MNSHLAFNKLFRSTVLFTLGLTLGLRADVFLHTVAEDNGAGSGTTVLNDPALNGRPQAMVFATQRFGTYNAHEIGVGYDEGRARWVVRNEDQAPLAAGMMFNVLALPESTPAVYRHTTTAENTREYYTYLEHPASDFRPDALLLVTPNNATARDLGPIGVWYDGRRWSIYRQDKQALEIGIQFNVMVSEKVELSAVGKSALGLRAAYLHRATPTTTRGYLTPIGHREATDFVFTTHNWRDTGPYNFHPVGTWFDGQEWLVLNQDRGEIVPDTKFNVFIFAASPVAPALVELPAREVSRVVSAPANIPVLDQTMGGLEFVNQEAEPVSFSVSYVLDGERRILSSGTVEPGATFRHEVLRRAQDFRIRAETLRTPTRVLINQFFVNPPSERIATPSSAKPAAPNAGPTR